MMQETIEWLICLLLWQTGALTVSRDRPFQLASGNHSPLYINCRLLISAPEARNLITASAVRTVKQCGMQPQCIAGGETAGIPFAAWLAHDMALPMVYVRKHPKNHGLGSQVEGSLEPGTSVLLYEDLITDGQSKIAFVEAIRRAGAGVASCLVVFDREQGGGELLQQHGVTLVAMAGLSTCLAVGTNAGYLSTESRESVEEYRQDPQTWHARRGYAYNP